MNLAPLALVPWVLNFFLISGNDLYSPFLQFLTHNVPRASPCDARLGWPFGPRASHGDARLFNQFFCALSIVFCYESLQTPLF